MNRARLLLTAALAGCAAAVGAWQAPPPTPPHEGWRTFEGSWSAAGHRETLATEGDRPAAILRIAGSIVLTTGDGLGRGFRGEALGFFDGGDVSVGRAVWTDDRGDRIFSQFKGEPPQTGRRVQGTITGGTGRYAGLTGEYSFVWQYVVLTDEGDVQGRTVGLSGRFRFGEGARR